LRLPNSPPLSLLFTVILLVGVILLMIGLALVLRDLSGVSPDAAGRPPVAAPPSGDLLFCAWNVENLCDDQDDPGFRDDIEDWYGRDPAALQAKLAVLAGNLARLNDGRGPDILAVVEVENRRAIELLRRALNTRLDAAWHYPESGLIHRDNRLGRPIEPAILSRLPAREWADRRFRSLRIVGASIDAGGSRLVVVASHWTSRLGGEETGGRRVAYAQALYGAFLDRYRADPKLDMLLAGDFNDEPADPSVRVALRASGNWRDVRPGGRQPVLYDLMSGLNANRDGTYSYRGRWSIYDHIVVSPGLMDPSGWLVLPGTLKVINDAAVRATMRSGPLRFGNEHNPRTRGPSDHFAVTVRLRVGQGAPARR
jgi:endonuclease/exonuclease/phosphatase family metal-dependent hydrolase